MPRRLETQRQRPERSRPGLSSARKHVGGERNAKKVSILAWGCLLAVGLVISPCRTVAADTGRSALPVPLSPFKGTIGKTYKESKEDWQSPPAPPKGAPNVLIILLDDVGFGQTSTFGGPVNTPTLQKLADEGLRYNTFHTTAL